MAEHTKDIPILPPSPPLPPTSAGPSEPPSAEELDLFDLIPKPDPEARIGPFPLGQRAAAELSRAEILTALPDAPKLYNNGDGIIGARISRIATGVVVKHGSSVHLHESSNMQLVGDQTTIGIPKIYDAWQTAYDDDTKVTYIVMQYIDGHSLYERRNDLSPTIWERINGQLLSYLRQLHKLTSPRPGPVGGGVSEGHFFTDYGAGPFSSKAEIEEWFERRLLVSQEWGKAAPDLSFAGDFSHLVMCYMDVHLNNILIDDAYDIWLVDWTNAGFYPPFFEVAGIEQHSDSKFFLPVIQALHTSETQTKVAKLASVYWALTTGFLCEPRGALDHSTPQVQT